MPFKSEAQRRWAAEQVRTGKWTQSQFDEWNSETPTQLPERLNNPKTPGPRKVKAAKVIK